MLEYDDLESPQGNVINVFTRGHETKILLNTAKITICRILYINRLSVNTIHVMATITQFSIDSFTTKQKKK